MAGKARSADRGSTRDVQAWVSTWQRPQRHDCGEDASSLVIRGYSLVFTYAASKVRQIPPICAPRQRDRVRMRGSPSITGI
jgi:hypothetical protein